MAYVPELNGIRGLAILVVMMFHAHIPVLQGGFIGVDIFFVLSGFLITALLIKEFDSARSISLKDFYMRRVLRLGPALLAFLAVFCLVSIVAVEEEKARRNLIDALIALFYLANWARALDIHPLDYLGHTWSLSIEEQFYIVWPLFLLMLLRLTDNRWHIVAVTVAIALISWGLRCYFVMNDVSLVRIYNGLDTRADALMVGCVPGVILSSGLIRESGGKRLARCLAVTTPLSVVLLFIFLTHANWRDPGMYYWGLIVIEVLTVLLVLDILKNPESIIRRALSVKWLVWVGSISYGLYLWHYPIYRAMYALGFNGIAIATIGTLATFAIAILSYYLLELPVLNIKKRFTRTVPDNGILRSPAAAPTA